MIENREWVKRVREIIRIKELTSSSIALSKLASFVLNGGRGVGLRSLSSSC